MKMSSYAPLFNLIDSDQWNHNLINFNPKTVCLSTNYYVQQMFGCNLGNWYLPYEGESETGYYLNRVYLIGANNTAELVGVVQDIHVKAEVEENA